MNRKICVITGSRAEYGLLRRVMQEIKNADELVLQLIVTGMHLSPEFGLTFKEIERDGFRIDRKVEMMTSSDTPIGIAKSMGLGMIGFADALYELKPDLLLVLGDRFEIFSAVASALVARLPVAHLHGGEKTKGSFDEALRHSITKMSAIHFVAANEYKERVIQLGEIPERVFLVGGLGVDNINSVELLSRRDLEVALGIKFDKKNLLITFHPVTLEASTATSQMSELLAALGTLRNTKLLFTMPNADTEGRALVKMVEDFVAQHPNANAFASLGQLNYLSCIAQVDGVVGNSSSGLTEVPSFKKGTINIGERQEGRLQAKSVINCAPTRKSIELALEKLYMPEFQARMCDVRNPYGCGGASKKIVEILKTYPLDGIVKKVFYDQPSRILKADSIIT
jgi:GDP/UDP-N,N'-diacetylbacillosamine 2-epimerase (hydrolysing)